FAAVPEEGAEQGAVLLHDIDLRVERGRQPSAEVPRLAKSLSGKGKMLLLHVVVVRADDGFLAGKVVVGGAQREIRAGGDVANGGLFEALFPEQAERGLEHHAARFL